MYGSDPTVENIGYDNTALAAEELTAEAVERRKLNLYRTELAQTRKVPLLIYIHGGSWRGVLWPQMEK